MGQKVHPIGMRLGIIKNHTSVWYAAGQAYADKLLETLTVRESILN
jgi:small subunit ribosomal protein S3